MPDALMMRLLQSGVLAAPHSLDPPHGCCWMADEGHECGLWCGHDGDHVPCVPGVYLPPPIISPVSLLPLQRGSWPFDCPLCGIRSNDVSCDAPYRVLRGIEGSASWLDPGLEPGSIECAWRFQPCGCEGREVLPLLTEATTAVTSTCDFTI